MRLVLALATLIAFGATANAQDKAKSDMSNNAELRIRYFNIQNPTANEKNSGTDSYVQSRFKWDVGFKASEKLSAHATLLHDSTWGQPGGETPGDRSNATGNAPEENFLSVNQIYANWMISNDFGLKLGRMNYQIGDGYVVAFNDWEQQPGAFEGALGTYEFEFGKLQAMAFKLAEYGKTNAATPSWGTAYDNESNMYGLNFDLKTMPEWLKAFNLHVLQINNNGFRDGSAGNTAHFPRSDSMRYGASAAFAFQMIDLTAWYASHSGETQSLITGPKTDTSGNMMAAEVGATFENFMGTRLSVGYHKDSGDEAATPTEDGTYDAFMNEKHGAAGMMDLFNFGNLTFTNIGVTMKPMDKTTVGLKYWMFSRTEAAVGSATFTAGTRGGSLPKAAGSETDDVLGSEIDVWATHEYDSNLSTTLRIGMFSPGDYFKNQTVVAPATPPEDGITEVMLEGKMTF